MTKMNTTMKIELKNEENSLADKNQDENIFIELEKNWGCPFVLRNLVGKFSGGLLHPRTLANLDSLGRGPAGKINVGNRVAYPTTELIKWLEARTVKAGRV